MLGTSCRDDWQCIGTIGQAIELAICRAMAGELGSIVARRLNPQLINTLRLGWGRFHPDPTPAPYPISRASRASITVQEHIVPFHFSIFQDYHFSRLRSDALSAQSIIDGGRPTLHKSTRPLIDDAKSNLQSLVVASLSDPKQDRVMFDVLWSQFAIF